MTDKFKLPDTGQNSCYNKEGLTIPVPKPGEEFFGQDGCFSVHPISFCKLGRDGKEIPDNATWEKGLRMIKDNNTGLIWEVKSPVKEDVNYAEDQYSWSEFQEVYVKKLNKSKYGGFTDWRVPNKDELRSILDYSRSNPAIDLWYFPHCKVDFYWCSVTYEMQDYFGWGLFFGLGSGIVTGKNLKRYVRAVRGGFDTKFGVPDKSRFKDNGDGTITDTVTRLMWQQGENPRMNWFDAMKNCSSLDLGGFKDWRLPNIKELNSILDLTYSDGWWYYKDFFPADGLVPPLLHYFSSTPFEKYYVWVTNFCFGYDGYYANKKSPLLHRAVRNIDVPDLKAPVFRIPSTNQLLCYDDEGNEIPVPKPGKPFYGQAGNFDLNPVSFTKLRSGGGVLDKNADWNSGLRMVKDENTGLIWEVKSPNPGDINFSGDKYTWIELQENYIDKLNKSSYGGFDDWRIPNKEELRSIVDYSGLLPAVDKNYFPDILAEFYWSKDVYGADTQLGWGIYFGYGCGICYLKTQPYFIMAVRGGYNRAFGDVTKYSFKDNGDGTISDLVTGLMWMKEETPFLNQLDALKFCEQLDLAGYKDWRMPSMKEVTTILNLNFKDGLWYHKEYFPNTQIMPQGFYWASNTYGGTFGWGTNFQFGYDGYYAGKKTGKYPFRPVRIIK
ncbi:MAG TPA: DUF1566 domain-containing protein [Firmicutes bacterium]|nr:DUF1566 domain-containing protein [Bacillota bacterium]